MIKAYFIFQPIFCVYLANDVKGQPAKVQRKAPFNSNTANASTNFISSPVSNIGADTDKTKTMCMHGFPDVIYPTSILDNQPFYFNVNGFDADLGAFGKEVKSAFKDISSNNNKNKEINLTKNQDNNKMKLTSQPNSSMSQDKHIAKQEYMKIISGQDNEKVIFNEINETEHNVSIFVQDNVPRDVSQISRTCLKKNNSNVIEECVTYDDSVIPVENEAIDDILPDILFRNETLNQICEIKNTLFEESMIDEHQQQPQNGSVEGIFMCIEDQFIASHSTNNTFSTNSFSLSGESSKENEILYPLLHLFNN